MRALLTYFVYISAFLAALAAVRRPDVARKLSSLRGRDAALALSALAAISFAIAEPGRLFEDFTDAYYAGGASVLAGRVSAEQLFERGVHGFVNVPILAHAFAPFALLPVGAANALFLALGVAATVLAWRQLVTLAGLDRPRALLLGLLFAVNGPLMNSLREGNTSHFALCAVTSAMLALRRRRDLFAGALLGLAALFKLPLLVFGAHGVLRRRYRAVLGGALVLGATAALSLLVFGVDAHVVWYERFVAPASREPVAAFNVQSLPALLARWSREGGVHDWDGYPLAEGARRAASVFTGTLFLAAFAAALWPRREAAPKSVLSQREYETEILLVLVLACISSPLAWSHYYTWMLAPVAFALAPSSPLADTPSTRVVAVVALLAVSLPVAWPPQPPAGLLAQPYLLALSHYLFGGVAIFALLVRARARLRQSAPEPATLAAGEPS